MGPWYEPVYNQLFSLWLHQHSIHTIRGEGRRLLLQVLTSVSAVCKKGGLWCFCAVHICFHCYGLVRIQTQHQISWCIFKQQYEHLISFGYSTWCAHRKQMKFQFNESWSISLATSATSSNDRIGSDCLIHSHLK